MTKQLWKTKTFWTNILSVVIMLVVSGTGVEIPPEFAVSALGVINVILRVITKEAIEW